MCPLERTYECRPQATVVPLPVAGEPSTQFALSCALQPLFPNGMPGYWKQGNYIVYDINTPGGMLRLDLQEVAANCCEPKPEQCHCNTMLRRVLQENLNIDRIDGYFVANPFMAGCRCYLGVAADFEFKWVDDCDDVDSKRMEFTRTNYVQVCEKLKKQKCMGKNARFYKE